MRQILSGEYCGTLRHIHGERAMLLKGDRKPLMEDDDVSTVLAQFDNLDLEWSHGWHELPYSDFCSFNYCTPTKSKSSVSIAQARDFLSKAPDGLYLIKRTGYDYDISYQDPRRVNVFTEAECVSIDEIKAKTMYVGVGNWEAIRDRLDGRLEEIWDNLSPGNGADFVWDSDTREIRVLDTYPAEWARKDRGIDQYLGDGCLMTIWKKPT